jgi:hypothetical protein
MSSSGNGAHIFLFNSEDKFRKPAKLEQMPYTLNTEIAANNRAA